MLSFVAVTVIVAAAVVSGLPTTHSRLRIVGGADSTIEEHPYQVAIELEGETLLCGGSILSSKVILTAAHPFCVHCQSQEENFSVRVGSSYREHGGQLFPFNLEQLIVHPNYAEGHRFDYDVAIIKLDEEIKFSRTTAPVPLIALNQDIEDGARLIVTGYGLSSGDSGGPLINESGQLVGVVSWGTEKLSETDPAVFTNLAYPSIHKFIEEYLLSS